MGSVIEPGRYGEAGIECYLQLITPRGTASWWPYM